MARKPHPAIKGITSTDHRTTQITHKWIVSYSGGRGPNVWDQQTEVEAQDIRAALDAVEPKVKEAGGEIDSIEVVI